MAYSKIIFEEYSDRHSEEYKEYQYNNYMEKLEEWELYKKKQK